VRRYLVELIGTFFLVFTVITAVNETPASAAIAIGSVLMVMVYAGGHISGAHYNPAISLAVLIRRRLGAADLLPYWAAQLLGALLAALVGLWLLDIPSASALSGDRIWQVLVVEFLFTFALAWVVLNVATSKDHPSNDFYGLAIGFTVTAGAFAIGPISGAAFNPAVVFGLAVTGMVSWSSIWVYLLATLAGGALGALTFAAVNSADR
jgi:aquaporin Z